ncbi:MAG: hypothetical protein H7138_18470 [Myxococcales bacterium]|nr:hypothetical protein [Myxococcales bacterium]
MSVSKEQVQQVREARWEEWGRMAKQLPNQHVLSIELLRTANNETLAIFTVVKDRQPVQHVLQGDALGGSVKAFVTPRSKQVAPGCAGAHVTHAVAPDTHAAPMAAPLAASLAAAITESDAPASADSIALGQPPPKQPPSPGIVALGTVMLASAFNLGEQVDVDAKR